MRPLLVLALLILSALPSFAAETFKAPQALIKALYAYDTTETAEDAAPPYQPFFSRGLSRLFQKDRDATPEGEVGH